tara:strand:+ start:542 stop:1087 length:546 start_codon:yes stop_codon:yes gene_type:complete
MKKLFLFLFFLFFCSNVFAEDRDIRLNKLFDELKVNQAKVASIIEQEIWTLWSTHPSNQNLTDLLAKGSELVLSQKYIEAVKIFTDVINSDPTWAEAWNKRATVLYLLEDYESSQKDIDNVLKLEQRHFGALAGQGLVNIKLKNYEKAIKSYRQALEIYPSMKSPELMIKQIEALIKEELI